MCLNRLRKNPTNLSKSFLQRLKPVESTQFTSALKHRPPEEKDFFPQPARRVKCIQTPEARYGSFIRPPDGSLSGSGMRCAFGGAQCVVHYLTGFTHDCVQMCMALKALRVNFVDVLGAGGAGRKPAAFRDDLQAADGSVIPWRRGQFGGDRLPRQV